MPRSKRPDPNQMSLFDALKREQEEQLRGDHPGGMDCQRVLRCALSDAVKNCPHDRFQIAATMSRLVDQEITKYMLDSWLAESKEGHRFPAEFLPAFCRATGSTKPLQVLSEVAGLFAMAGPEALRAEIQKLDEQSKRLATEKKKRMVFLQELESRA